MITKDLCTGCGACAAICPRNCIEMRRNSVGQLVPKVNGRLCVDCMLCKKTCPQNEPVELHLPKACYAAWSKDERDLKHSASGGIAATFTRHQLTNDGVAFGCDYSSQADLCHFQVKSEDDLDRIRGSKYSHGNAWCVFPQIKDFLHRGKTVLFVGTPCQVAALKKYIGRNDVPLITVDLVCHGTPPGIYLQQYLRYLGIELPVDKIAFRGEYDQHLTIWKDGRIVYQKKAQEDVYFSAFYGNVISNESCYSCRYAQRKRVSDITIGDFWGLGKLQTLEYKHSRASLVLINTEKGQRFFDVVKQDLLWEQRSTEEGICGNGRLLAPPGKKKEAEVFQRIYACGVFDFVNSLRVTYRTVWIKDVLQKKISKKRKERKQKK